MFVLASHAYVSHQSHVNPYLNLDFCHRQFFGKNYSFWSASVAFDIFFLPFFFFPSTCRFGLSLSFSLHSSRYKHSLSSCLPKINCNLFFWSCTRKSFINWFLSQACRGAIVATPTVLNPFCPETRQPISSIRCPSSTPITN
jgi:hypothetical protein